MEPDLRSPTLRILECDGCAQPVWGEPASGVVELRCGYCGREDRRELSPLTTPSDVAVAGYRGSAIRDAGRARRIDLAQSPKGYPARPTKELLRERLAAARERLAALGDETPERADVEYELLWAGATLASAYVMAKDALRARAVLESALEIQRAPVYRALVLARLARLAAFGGGEELSERWLAAIPSGLRVPEVAVDVRIARAMMARARGDADGMIAALGSEDGLFGASRPLAMALVVDALETKGDIRAARQAYRRGSRGAALRFAGALATFELAPRTRARSAKVGFVALGLVGALLVAIGLVLAGHLLAGMALTAICVVAAVILRLFF